MDLSSKPTAHNSTKSSMLSDREKLDWMFGFVKLQMQQTIIDGKERLRRDLIYALAPWMPDDERPTAPSSDLTKAAPSSSQPEQFGEYEIISKQEKHRLDGQVGLITQDELVELGIGDKETKRLIKDTGLVERTNIAVKDSNIRMFAYAVLAGASKGDQGCISIYEKYGKAFQYVYRMTWEQAAERKSYQ